MNGKSKERITVKDMPGNMETNQKAVAIGKVNWLKQKQIFWLNNRKYVTSFIRQVATK